LTGLGVAAGLVAALAAGAGLSRLLYAVSPRDPLTLASCVLLLMALGLGGGLVAARPGTGDCSLRGTARGVSALTMRRPEL